MRMTVSNSGNDIFLKNSLYKIGKFDTIREKKLNFFVKSQHRNGNISMRIYIFHMIEFVFFLGPALVMMNETEDDKLPKPGKFIGTMFCVYICSLVGRILYQCVEQPAEGIIRILTVLSSLLFCCILFTGGVAKILLSIVILDLWMGIGEMFMTIVYCIICGKDLAFIFLPQYEENILLQWAVEFVIGFLMLFASRKIFYTYKKSFVLEGKLLVAFALLYIAVVGGILLVKPLGLHGYENYPYHLTLLFTAASSCIIIIGLLCYNQNQVMKARFQSLYLKQKMEREYALVFADMDRDMRRFRHDVKKHMDALSYLSENHESSVPDVQIKKYQQDLKKIYTELTYGNYCSKYDINLVLMEIENVCRRQDGELSVNLKTLDLDSLPVHIRVQLFEMLCEWAEEAMEWGTGVSVKAGRTIFFQGMTSARFHTLKIVLQWECPVDREKKAHGCVRTYIREQIDTEKTAGKVKRLLYEYGSTVKIERSDKSVSLLISWHERYMKGRKTYASDRNL